MALPFTWIIGAFAANVVLGALLVLGVFAFMERQITLGAIGGILIGVAAIYAEATVGERYMTLTVSGMKNLIIIGALGAVVGVVVVVLVVEPEV